MTNRTELAHNIFRRLSDEFFFDEMNGNGKLEMRIAEMLRKEVSKFDIIKILPEAKKT